MCCSNWHNGWNNGNGRRCGCRCRCQCRCVCWSPFGTWPRSDSGSAPGADWPRRAEADWTALTAGDSGCGCNG